MPTVTLFVYQLTPPDGMPSEAINAAAKRIHDTWEKEGLIVIPAGWAVQVIEQDSRRAVTIRAIEAE